MSIRSVGQTAPTFSLNSIDGKSYTLNGDGARLTLAVFFKTTCPTCKLAWPYVEKLHQAYAGAGLAVWGISQQDGEASARFAADHGGTFAILVDSAWRVSKWYDPDFVPTLFLMDSFNQIIETVVAFDKAGLNRVSQTIAARLKVSPAVIASDDDGNPPFRPG